MAAFTAEFSTGIVLRTDGQRSTDPANDAHFFVFAHAAQAIEHAEARVFQDPMIEWIVVDASGRWIHVARAPSRPPNTRGSVRGLWRAMRRWYVGRRAATQAPPQ